MSVCSRRIRLAFVLACGLTLAGCAGAGEDSLPRRSVSGKVALDDRPLAKGSIMFDPADPGRPDAVSSGAVISDGVYSLPRAGGLTPGKYRVAILGDEGDSAPAGPPGLPPKLTAAKKPMVPEKYNAQSTLTVEVKTDESNTFDFALKSR